MFGAIGTTLCFALTPVFANSAARRLGSIPANFWRLVVAVIVLGFWAHLFGSGVRTAAWSWFFVGGLAGFGIGGVSMFLSLPRLGSSLSTLIVQCVAALVAAALEFIWLGTSLTGSQMFFAALTLAGVTIGLLPHSLVRVSPGRFQAGVGWALLSAVGQGAGAVFSRKAFAVAASVHELVDPGTAAYHRTLGGLVFGGAVLVFVASSGGARWLRDLRSWPWVLGNALTGPILGVTCYQWALRSTPAGLVQPIVAIAPLLTIPFSIWIECADRPRLSYYAGAVLAIAGATGIMLAR